MNFGNTCPVLWNLSSGVTTTALAGGLALPASAVTLTITADINGTPLLELVSLHRNQEKIPLLRALYE
ncbi:uncharacterized protein PHALS_01017 [Plasmopara halstedii]|uniref:Uncharacterized protein n=1 Tax=Plasmopara halstedii TaxID=4781 RepID=A0A0P1AUS6_PLAHL|nr:uncharacterized protein PHALS_01017 [Plasmopara halstedii]CEG44670.1 hypothetical protein PHALS_01017 [Plasmopara halstedii]|eukprot:XP_024581039.1 hypothetical protein PHALS_01017 [Plasmopara halstedii]